MRVAPALTLRAQLNGKNALPRVSSKASKLAQIEPNKSGFIGVFDSGIGGLSVLQALRAEMPQERFVYWADSDFAPYGERSEQFVIERSHFITQQLIAQGPMKALVVACNTATAVAIESLRATFPSLPFIGVEPALKPALAQTKTLRVGVMGTQGTLRSLRFEKLLQSVLNELTNITGHQIDVKINPAFVRANEVHLAAQNGAVACMP